jgi:hypothetical protein
MKTKNLFLIALIGLMMIMPLVSAAGVDDPITSPDWLIKTANFLKLGTTWGELIAAICVLFVIVAALYDILSFTAFENLYVKLGIGIAIGLITAISGGAMKISAFFLQFAGGATALDVAIIVIMAIVFFVIASFFTGKLKMMKAKNKAEAIRAKAEVGAEESAAGVNIAKRMGREGLRRIS